MGISHNCKPNRRCKICGKPDFCNWVEFSNGDTLEYCHRVSGNVNDTTVGKDGQVYILKRITEQGFSVWETSEQNERNRKEYLEKLKSEGKRVIRKEKSKTEGRRIENTASLSIDYHSAVNSAKKAAPERIDEVLRCFLSLLVLEKKHVGILRLEWDDEMLSFLTKTWSIKSVPPEDQIRFSSKERLENESRKKIMEKLVSRVGVPEGVPGFYRRKDGVWTFCYLCGIAYPIINSHGQIVGLEIGNDYPTVEKFSGNEKAAEYRYQLKDKKAGWYEIPRVGESYDYSKASLVWEYGGEHNKIALTKKNLPPGKVSGKYKPFFSEKTRVINGKVVNLYDRGCSGGSPASCYVKDGDDTSIVYVTEGAKKAMVANYMMNIPVMMLSGVGKFGVLFEKEDGYATSAIDEMKNKGASLFVIAYDADKKENMLVLKAEQGFVKKALEGGLKIAVAEWNANWGKGLDDILLTGVVPNITLVA